ncbi:MAG: carboxymuconolactone decarboxylase family protein [Candidatus Binatia bacterium]|jgi:4-carboxymuconolactone decarboxylase
MRLPTIKRDDLSPENQQRWDRITAGRTGGGGPYSALIHAPILADHLATAENYYRKDAALGDADRELVILATAREFEAHYPWTRHEIRARQAGLREDTIEAVRAHGSLEKLMPRERLFVEIVRSLLRQHRLSNEIFTMALAELGPQKFVEMVALIGHYSTIGSVANAFDVRPPDGSKTF